MDKVLAEWIMQKSNEGYSLEAIKQSLVNAGHDPQQIDALIFEMKEFMDLGKKPFFLLSGKWIIIAVIIFIIVGGGFFMLFLRNPTVAIDAFTPSTVFYNKTKIVSVDEEAFSSLGSNIILGKRFQEKNRFEYWFGMNGPEENPLGEEADFLKLSITEYDNKSMSEQAFDDMHLFITQLPSSPNVAEAHSSVEEHKAFYENVLLGSPENRTLSPGILYSAVQGNHHLILSIRFASNITQPDPATIIATTEQIASTFP